LSQKTLLKKVKRYILENYRLVQIALISSESRSRVRFSYK